MAWPRSLPARACVAWLPLVPLAILNGLLRELLLEPWLGSRVALPLSGLLLALLVVAYAWLVTPWLLRWVPRECRSAGAVWLLLTLAFEFPFGHFVLGRSWSGMLEVLDVSTGNLMPLVLLVTALAPCLAHRWRSAGHSRGQGASQARRRNPGRAGDRAADESRGLDHLP
jgi:hypothetical protein